MAKEIILVSDRYSSESLATLRQSIDCEIIKVDQRPKKEDLKNATAMLIRSRTKINADVIEHAPNLKVIITSTSGFDHIDFDSTQARKITVMYTPEANTESAAEHTLLLILGVLKNLNEAGKTLRDGRWKDDVPAGGELKGKMVGLIGLGRVGSRVAALLQAFGAEVIAHDPYQTDDVFQKLKIERMGLTEVFTQADILSFHVPLTKETRHMVRTETLELTQEGLILINTSRGEVFDESAVASALESKQIRAAGLDVFEHEPLSRDSRLRKLPVLLTPHMGAHTEEAFAKASELAVTKLIRFLKSGEISDNLPLQLMP